MFSISLRNVHIHQAATHYHQRLSLEFCSLKFNTFLTMSFRYESRFRPLLSVLFIWISILAQFQQIKEPTHRLIAVDSSHQQTSEIHNLCAMYVHWLCGPTNFIMCYSMSFFVCIHLFGSHTITLGFCWFPFAFFVGVNALIHL